VKTLVTGAGGFLGGAIARLLLQQGCEVRALVRRPAEHLRAAGIEVRMGALEQRGALIEAFRGVDCVFHCAAKAGVWGAWQDYYDTNVTGTRNVLEACLAAGVQKLVYTSSPSVVFGGHDAFGVSESEPYPETFLNYYSETKAAAEQLVLGAHRRGELEVVALRPHLIWGPGDPHLLPRVLEAAAKGRLRRVGDGSNRVDTTYVDNAAWAHWLAAQKLPSVGGHAYFISDNHPVRLWDFINEVLQRLGRPPVEGSLSLPIARTVGSVLEWVYRTLRLSGEPPITRFSACQLGMSHYFDISAAERDLGYAPLVDYATGLERTVEALR
jgi:nucleoside-diphosphate-sugar epimerase